MEHSRATVLKRRYSDGYLVAAVSIGFGRFIKAAGVVIAIMLLLASFGAKDHFGDGVVYVGVFLAVVISVLFFVFGVLVSAQGQILMASLDVAINSSSLLTEDEKADIIFSNEKSQRQRRSAISILTGVPDDE